MDRGIVNPFARTDGERLEHRSFRNHAGLLVTGAVTLTLEAEDQLTIAQEIPFLEEHVVMARLLEGDMTGHGKDSWWESLIRIASPGTVHFHQKVGPRYAYVRTDSSVTTTRVLAAGLHRFDTGMVLYQKWIRGFNHRMTRNTIWPM